MKQKLIQAVPLASMIVALAVGYVLAHPLDFHICSSIYTFKSQIGCLDSSIQSIGNPLFRFVFWILVVGIVLPFVSARVFRSWLKFAAWTLPLAFVWIAITPVSWTGLGIDFFPYYRINAAHDAGIAFTVLSLLLIAWKYFRRSSVS